MARQLGAEGEAAAETSECTCSCLPQPLTKTNKTYTPHGWTQTSPLMSSIIPSRDFHFSFFVFSHHAPPPWNPLGPAQQRVRWIQGEISLHPLLQVIHAVHRTSYTSPWISPISTNRPWTILSLTGPWPSRPQLECESQIHSHRIILTTFSDSDKDHQKEYDFEIKFFDEIVPEVGLPLSRESWQHLMLLLKEMLKNFQFSWSRPQAPKEKYQSGILASPHGTPK